MNCSPETRKITLQRVEALKHTLSRKNLKEHLGDSMQTRYCKRVSMEVSATALSPAVVLIKFLRFMILLLD
ncbi:MAG: hypothetical protein AAFN77_18355, partial [Planctomycetota bacterium]